MSLSEQADQLARRCDAGAKLRRQKPTNDFESAETENLEEWGVNGISLRLTREAIARGSITAEIGHAGYIYGATYALRSLDLMERNEEAAIMESIRQYAPPDIFQLEVATAGGSPKLVPTNDANIPTVMAPHDLTPEEENKIVDLLEALKP